jgi:hypothetical protein
MSAKAKLNEARKRFHAAEIRKTGHNKFSDYYYFELSDFLVPALTIFDELKLSAIVSFGTELATMEITDLEDETSVHHITSPMSTASLKACHEVQNLGAVETYLRRYLWVAALEIVEHDALDSSPGAEPRQDPERAARRERWLADQFAAIDAASNVGELKRAVDAALLVAREEKDAEAESQIHAAAAVKASKAKRGTKEPA